MTEPAVLEILDIKMLLYGTLMNGSISLGPSALSGHLESLENGTLNQQAA